VRKGRGALRSELRGEVETEDGVLVIGRILVHHRLMAQEEVRGVVEEVHNDYPFIVHRIERCTGASISKRPGSLSPVPVRNTAGTGLNAGFRPSLIAPVVLEASTPSHATRIV
jgi:hypothetical protein